ncbi:MAG: hypothetical protein WC661_05240 [Opitutaceae bacterium]|jgi:hypothetical protein
MSLRLFGVLVAVVFSVADASAFIERRVQRSFEAPAAASLKIDTFSGAVHIARGTGQTIEVTVIQRADVEKEADMDARVKDLDLRMTATDTGVNIVTRYNKRATWSWKGWPPLMITYEIKVPAQCDVQVVTLDGGIVVGSIKGRMDLANDSGPIFTGEIDGDVKAHSRIGDIAITACTGAIKAHTRTGNVTVGRAFGRTELSSDGGYIELQRAAGEVVVHGSGTDAKVGFVPPIVKPAKITTSGGEITLVMETTSACTLDLSASIFGRVKVRNLTIKATGGGPGKSRLAGTVNGGGALITADANGGNIFVRGLDPIPAADVADPTKLPQK